MYCRAISFTRCCSKIIGLNDYYVARLCSPRNDLARVSFIVTSVIFPIIVLGSIIFYLFFFFYKNELTNCQSLIEKATKLSLCPQKG